MDNSDLTKRMKRYEEVSKSRLMNREPVIIRIDGRAFHTFTRGFVRPFDEVLIKTMQETTKYLCENIQGCVLGYTQSDEITLILIDYKRLNTDSWFNYEVQKMCSVAASMATLAFNKFFSVNYDKWGEENMPGWDIGGTNMEIDSSLLRLENAYSMALKMGAMFDARVFNIPKEEVTNNVYWRQLDASRNSVQMVGHANFSNKELQNKSCSNIQDMLMSQKGINWNDYPTYQKRGSCVVKNEIILESNDIMAKCRLRDFRQSASNWIIDKDIPIFKGDDREYIEQLIYIG